MRKPRIAFIAAVAVTGACLWLRWAAAPVVAGFRIGMAAGSCPPARPPVPGVAPVGSQAVVLFRSREEVR